MGFYGDFTWDLLNVGICWDLLGFVGICWDQPSNNWNYLGENGDELRKHQLYMGVSGSSWGYHNARWSIMENPIFMDDDKGYPVMA